MLLVNQLSGFGILTFAKEARAIIDAMSVRPNMARMRTIDLTVRGFLGAALWPKVDVMWFLAAHDEQAGRLNWKDPGSFTLTAVNGPAFATDRGFTGNFGAGAILDTGWDWATDGSQYTQNDAHLSIYQRTNSGNVPNLSQQNASYRAGVSGKTGAVGSGSRVNSATGVSPPSGGTQPQQMIARRNNSTQASIVRDGVEVTAPTTANSTTGANTSDFAFLIGGNVYTNDQVAGGSLGAYLDDAEALTFYKIWYSYMRAVGADT